MLKIVPGSPGEIKHRLRIAGMRANIQGGFIRTTVEEFAKHARIFGMTGNNHDFSNFMGTTCKGKFKRHTSNSALTLFRFEYNERIVNEEQIYYVLGQIVRSFRTEDLFFCLDDFKKYAAYFVDLQDTAAGENITKRIKEQIQGYDNRHIKCSIGTAQAAQKITREQLHAKALESLEIASKQLLSEAVSYHCQTVTETADAAASA